MKHGSLLEDSELKVNMKTTKAMTRKYDEAHLVFSFTSTSVANEKRTTRYQMFKFDCKFDRSSQAKDVCGWVGVTRKCSSSSSLRFENYKIKE